MKITSKRSSHLPLHRFLLGPGLGFNFTLGACTTVPVEPRQHSPKNKASVQFKLQQQRFAQGKALYLNKQYAEAASVLFPLAQQGHTDAQYTIGYMYHYGHGFPRNEKESTRWIATAAARGHLLAQEALARINASHDPGGVASEPAIKP